MPRLTHVTPHFKVNVGSGESHSGGVRGFPVDLLIDVFGANLVVTAATGLTSNGRCPCVPLTWWTTIRKTFYDTLANNSVDVLIRRCGLCLDTPAWS